MNTIAPVFNSPFALALYTLCSEFKDAGHTPWYTSEQLACYLGIKVIPHYLLIKKALKEVTAKSGLTILIKSRCQNTKIQALQFIIITSALDTQEWQFQPAHKTILKLDESL